jgi:hypothetical protein
VHSGSTLYLRFPTGCQSSALQSPLFPGRRASWVRGPPARMSSSFSAPFYLYAALRGGHAGRRPAHPGILVPLLRIPVIAGFAKSTFSRATSILGTRTSGPHVFKFLRPILSLSRSARGHAGRRPAHPGILVPLLRIPVISGFAKSTFSRATSILGTRASGPHVFTFHRGHSVGDATENMSTLHVDWCDFAKALTARTKIDHFIDTNKMVRNRIPRQMLKISSEPVLHSRFVGHALQNSQSDF